jgi:hypothetical protein
MGDVVHVEDGVAESISGSTAARLVASSAVNVTRCVIASCCS